MIDNRKANRAVNFVKSLPHTKGRWAGRKFGMLDWQEKVIRDVFGTLKPDGLRQYKTVYLEVPKKSGKTELGGGVSNYMLFADNEIGAEVYYAAVDRDQAGLSYNVAAQMVEWSPELDRRAKVIRSTKRIWVPETASFSRVLSADVDNKHGVNLSGAIIDELHAHPNRALYDVLSQEGGAGAAREQPLWFIITTAGYDRNSICWELHEYARQVINGTIVDPTFYGVIYGVPEDADWEDEREWVNANPSIDRIFTIDDLREAYRRAKGNPVRENMFRRLRLNQWTASETRWLNVKDWDACVAEIALEGRECYGGLDLSSTTDLTAFAMCFPDDNDYHLRAHFWLPADNIEDREKRDRVPYQLWAREGWLTLTPGNVIDYESVLKQLSEYAAKYDIREIAFDRWNMELLRQKMDGFTMVEFGQGYKSMSPAAKEFERLVMSGKVHHDANPILRWNLDNTIIVADAAENIKPDKALSLDTPLPTPWGWKLMGDTSVGDVLFDEQGAPCRVVGVSDIGNDRECYRVIFSDGETIVADAEHEWSVTDVKAYAERKSTPIVKTTRELAKDTLRKSQHLQYRYAIQLAEPLQLPDQDFILDPYILGCWLGDGSTSGGYISSADKEIFDHFGIMRVNHAPCCGCRSKACLYLVEGLTPLLHELGILNYKRVPDGYLRGSVNQRLALLQGLMDTDGSIEAEGGFSGFCNTNPHLVEACRELATSLGYKPVVKEGLARCGDRFYGKKWLVTFTARQDMPPFRLSRKVARIPVDPTRRARGLTRQIKAVEQVASVPVKCVTVDSQSHLYLASKAMIPTHNSKATQRIDGVVASIMALDRAVRHESGPSIYETQGFDSL